MSTVAVYFAVPPGTAWLVAQTKMAVQYSIPPFSGVCPFQNPIMLSILYSYIPTAGLTEMQHNTAARCCLHMIHMSTKKKWSITAVKKKGWKEAFEKMEARYGSHLDLAFKKKNYSVSTSTAVRRIIRTSHDIILYDMHSSSTQQYSSSRTYGYDTEYIRYDTVVPFRIFSFLATLAFGPRCARTTTAVPTCRQ